MKFTLNRIRIVLAITFIFMNNGFSGDKKNSEYKKEIDAWHEQRIKNLIKEHGWLSLIALDWLHEGKNKIPSLGYISIHQHQLFFELENGKKGILNGKEFISGIIQPDKDKIVIGTKALSIILRDKKYAARIWDSKNKNRINFIGVDRYDVSKIWKIEARWVQYKKPKKIEILTVIPGIVEEGTVPGVAIFSLNGKEYRLEPTIDDDSTVYFFVFADRTNGKETYGGGRFLDADRPINGKIILDFNTSINPPCAFTSFATCPTPLPNNRLPVKIEAGEKKIDH